MSSMCNLSARRIRACALKSFLFGSPSASMLQWVHDQGWALPANAFVHLNTMQLKNTKIAKVNLVGLKISPIKELVFFGRLETRKVQFGACLLYEWADVRLRVYQYSVTQLKGYWRYTMK
jgi:hypothetical protein